MVQGAVKAAQDLRLFFSWPWKGGGDLESQETQGSVFGKTYGCGSKLDSARNTVIPKGTTRCKLAYTLQERDPGVTLLNFPLVTAGIRYLFHVGINVNFN